MRMSSGASCGQYSTPPMGEGTRMSDPISVISRTSPPNPLCQLYNFLKKAFLPAPSTNDNPDRLDVLLNVGYHNPPRTGQGARILDLGSGDCLLLEKLIAMHESRCFDSPIHYIGVDGEFRHTHPRWQDLISRARVCSSCFAEPELYKFDIEQLDTVNKFLQDKAPFTTIYIANVLHELSPVYYPKLFHFLADLLCPDGRVVLLDPDAEWSLQRWSTLHLLSEVKVEWEAEAVWFSESTIAELLELTGFTIQNSLSANRSTKLWQVVGTRKDRQEVSEEELVNARRRIIEFIEGQVSAETQKYYLLRHEVKEAFKQSGAMNEELLVKVMEFFCACASQARRQEVLRDLTQ